MCWKKAPGSRVARNKWQYPSGKLWAALAIACLALSSCTSATTPEQYTVRDKSAELLKEARQRLQLIPQADNDEARTEHARKASKLLKECLEDETSERDSTIVLLAAAGFVEGKEESSALVKETDLSKVSTDDLLLASSIALGTRHFAEADRLVTEALTRDDKRAEALETAISIRFELGRDDEVLEHIDELLKLKPENPEPLVVRAVVYENRGGHRDHAIAAYREYLKLKPEGSAAIRLRLADQLLHQGIAKEARDELNRVAAEAPALLQENPLLVGRLMHLQGLTDDALKLAESRIEQNEQDVEALLLAAQIQFSRMKYEAAAEALDRLLATDPANTEAHYLLGQVYARQGKSDEAKQQLARHQLILTTKRQLYELERTAAARPQDLAVRKELARRYAEIGLEDLSKFWEVAADALEGAKPSSTPE